MGVCLGRLLCATRNVLVGCKAVSTAKSEMRVKRYVCSYSGTTVRPQPCSPLEMRSDVGLQLLLAPDGFGQPARLTCIESSTWYFHVSAWPLVSLEV